MRAFSSSEEWGLLSSCGVQASHGGGFSRCRAQALGCMGFRSSSTSALECLFKQLWCRGLVAPRHVESSRTRHQIHVPCIGRQIPVHCTTREVQSMLFLRSSLNAYTSFKALNGLAGIKQKLYLAIQCSGPWGNLNFKHTVSPQGGLWNPPAAGQTTGPVWVSTGLVCCR